MLQRKASQPAEIPPIVHEALRSPGQSLDSATRRFMESRFGHEFSRVRVHTDSRAAESARAVNAFAYTVGPDVVFATGQYDPDSKVGRELIAHELTHTLQQGLSPATPLEIGPRDDVHERLANEAATGIETGSKPSQISISPPVLQRQDGTQNPPAPTPMPSTRQPNTQTPRHGMKTSCDVNVDPRDLTDFLLKNSFRTVGKGQPQIGTLAPGLAANSPCLAEASEAHEEQHVKNAAGPCQLFKKCVDDHTGGFPWLGDPTISYENFVECHNTNHNGLPADCIADEKSAYEVGIKKASELMNEPRCAKEKASLQANIAYWNSIKDNDPDCKTQSKGVSSTGQ